MARPKGFLFSPSPAQGETEDVYFSSQERARCKIHPMFLASLSQTQKGQSKASRPAVSPSGVGTAQFQLARPYSKLWRQLNKIIGVSRPNIAASFNKLLEHYYEWPHPPLLWTFHLPAVWQKVLEVCYYHATATASSRRRSECSSYRCLPTHTGWFWEVGLIKTTQRLPLHICNAAIGHFYYYDSYCCCCSQLHLKTTFGQFLH